LLGQTKYNLMQKGQSQLIEYVLTILFSVVILIGVTALIYSFYNNAQKQDVQNSLNEISLEVSNAILKIYQQGKSSTANPANSTSVLIASVNLNLPQKISNKNYEIDLIRINPLFTSVINFTVGGINVTPSIQTSGAKIVAKTTEDPKITLTKDLPNIDVNVQGSAFNGQNATLKYYRYNFNGTVYDKIILGEQGIIIDITQIS